MRPPRALLVGALAVALAGSLLPGTAPAPADAAGATYYVATTGSDDDPGTKALPWRTVAPSLRKLRPGDTLFIRGGVYREFVGWGIVPGKSTAPIRVSGYPRERVVIKGLLKLVKAHYWYVHRVNVTRDPDAKLVQALVKFTNGIGWRYTNSEVWGARGVSNLMVNSTVSGQPAHYRISGNCIHDNDATGSAFMNYHNIYLYPGYSSGPGLIQRNILYNAENGNNIKAAGPNKKTGAAYVTIRYNTMARAGQGVVVAYGSHHVKMVRNLIAVRRGGSSSYPAIRGFQVTGRANSAKDNAAFRYKKVLLSTSSSRPIRNAGGNRFVTPNFDSTGRCSGFHPQNSIAARYGRYA